MAKKNRELKVYYSNQKGRKSQNTWYGVSDSIEVPTIILKGLWLEKLGFEVGDKINVHCEEGRLIIDLNK